jgi:hypothetical protein
MKDADTLLSAYGYRYLAGCVMLGHAVKRLVPPAIKADDVL